MNETVNHSIISSEEEKWCCLIIVNGLSNCGVGETDVSEEVARAWLRDRTENLDKGDTIAILSENYTVTYRPDPTDEDEDDSISVTFLICKMSDLRPPYFDKDEGVRLKKAFDPDSWAGFYVDTDGCIFFKIRGVSEEKAKAWLKKYVAYVKHHDYKIITNSQTVLIYSTNDEDDDEDTKTYVICKEKEINKKCVFGCRTDNEEE